MMNATSEPPRYPSGIRLAIDPRDVWAVTRRPPNVPTELTRTFSDLCWKTSAVAHHASQVIELEQQECAQLMARLARQPNLVGIAQTCSSKMRFEYEAMLGAAYAAQNLLARAVIESLARATLEDAKRLPTLANLERIINETIESLPETATARNRVQAVLQDIKSWQSPDFFERASPRHRVVHRQHVRCSPIFATRAANVRMKFDANEALGVTFASKDPINCISHYSADIETGYMLLVRQDGLPPPPGTIYIAPPREIEPIEEPILARRALRVTQEQLRAAALLLDAVTDGDDPLATIVSRSEAAARAVLTRVDPATM
jgi:hypothetical protein